MSPFARCPLPHIPPTRNCSDSPMQLKLHCFCAHVRFVGQSLSTLHSVVLAAAQTLFWQVKFVGQSLLTLQSILLGAEHTPLLGAIATVRLGLPFESARSVTDQYSSCPTDRNAFPRSSRFTSSCVSTLVM